MKKKICLVIFIVLFVVSILVNVKLLFFSPAVSLKNIPFEGVITEADSGKIVVKGDGTNGCGLTEHYQIYNSDQIKIVNTNDELIQFTDLKKGTRISMRLWIKEKTLYNDMDRLDIVPVPSDSTSDARIQSNSPPELEPHRTSTSNSRRWRMNLRKPFRDLEWAGREEIGHICIARVWTK